MKRISHFTLIGKMMISAVVGILDPPHLCNAACTPTLATGWTNGLDNGAINAMAYQSDGKLVVAGSFTSVAGTTQHRVARFNTDGTLDANFTGKVQDGEVFAIAIQHVGNDDRILIGGSFTHIGDYIDDPPYFEGYPEAYFKARLFLDGNLDDSFDVSPWENYVRAIAVEADGRILIGGDFYGGDWDGRIARLTQDGSLDYSLFSGGGDYTGPNGTVRSVAVQADGKILIAGDFTYVGSVYTKYLARLLTNGVFDTNFVYWPYTNYVHSAAYAVKIMPDGKILVGSSGVSLFNTNGALLGKSLNPVGSDGTPQEIRCVAADHQSPYGLLAGGKFDYTTDIVSARHGLARYTVGQNPLTVDSWGDCTVLGNGSSINAMVVDGSGNVIVGGDFSTIVGTTRHGIAYLILGD